MVETSKLTHMRTQSSPPPSRLYTYIHILGSQHTMINSAHNNHYVISKSSYIIKQALGCMVGQLEDITEGCLELGLCEGPVGDSEGVCEGPLGATDGPVGRTDGAGDGSLVGLAVGANAGVPVKAVESRYVTDLRYTTY